MNDLRCMVGLHTGQREGGTMMFTCPRCRRSFWQRKDYSEITRYADILIENGQADEAQQLVREAVSKGKTR
jgi:uncharacterized C2H2 Zn-finger protein